MRVRVRARARVKGEWGRGRVRVTLVTAEHRPPASASRATRPKLSGTSLRIPPVMAVGIEARPLLLGWPRRGRPRGAWLGLGLGSGLGLGWG